VTETYATTQKWPTVVPLWVLAGGFGATVLIGAIAGLYPGDPRGPSDAHGSLGDDLIGVVFRG
jgi:hypothetical protein